MCVLGCAWAGEARSPKSVFVCIRERTGEAAIEMGYVTQ